MNPFFFVVALGLIATFIHLWVEKRPLSTVRILEIILLYQLVFSIGINGLLAFYGHVFMSDEIARYIGWPVGNPFQLEVGYTNLAFGILGVLSIWFRGHFWTATVLGISIWFLGDGLVHIRDLTMHNNTAPGNAGVPLYVDIIFPIIWLSLLVAYRLALKKNNTSFKDEATR